VLPAGARATFGRRARPGRTAAHAAAMALLAAPSQEPAEFLISDQTDFVADAGRTGPAAARSGENSCPYLVPIPGAAA